MCFYLKIVSFTVFFGLLLLKFCFCLIGRAVDFDDLVVFLRSHCQVTKLHFSRLYKFLVLIINKLPELSNLVCLPETLAL